MGWNGKNQDTGAVNERGFTLESSGREVPGVYWTPTSGDADRLVLLGHGGGANKHADYIVQIAQGLCGLGIAAMAIDGPGHGDRPGADQWDSDDRSTFAPRWQSDGGTAGMLADWNAAHDFIESEAGERLTGYLGFSMGTMMGLPVCVSDDRIRVAVLGLMGTWGPNKDDLIKMAPELTIPLRYLVQWDDEVVPREDCLELFGMLGSERKSLHANPGIHRNVPTFEVVSAVGYLNDQLSKLAEKSR